MSKKEKIKKDHTAHDKQQSKKSKDKHHEKPKKEEVVERQSSIGRYMDK